MHSADAAPTRHGRPRGHFFVELLLIRVPLCLLFVHVVGACCCTTSICTGWRRLIGSPKLQIIFHKRATKYRSLLRKMTHKDKGSYESSPPCSSERCSAECTTSVLYAIHLIRLLYRISLTIRLSYDTSLLRYISCEISLCDTCLAKYLSCDTSLLRNVSLAKYLFAIHVYRNVSLAKYLFAIHVSRNVSLAINLVRHISLRYTSLAICPSRHTSCAMNYFAVHLLRYISLAIHLFAKYLSCHTSLAMLLSCHTPLLRTPPAIHLYVTLLLCHVHTYPPSLSLARSLALSFSFLSPPPLP